MKSWKYLNYKSQLFHNKRKKIWQINKFYQHSNFQHLGTCIRHLVPPPSSRKAGMQYFTILCTPSETMAVNEPFCSKSHMCNSLAGYLCSCKRILSHRVRQQPFCSKSHMCNSLAGYLCSCKSSNKTLQHHLHEKCLRSYMDC